VTVDVAGTQAWAKDNKACWEITPLVEKLDGRLVQVGYDLSLFVRVPGMPAGDERHAAILALWDRLQEIARSLAPLLGGGGRIEVDPFEEAGRLRPETQFAAEIMLQARLFHASFAPASQADRERLRPLEQRLAELGLRAKTW